MFWDIKFWQLFLGLPLCIYSTKVMRCTKQSHLFPQLQLLVSYFLNTIKYRVNSIIGSQKYSCCEINFTDIIQNLWYCVREKQSPQYYRKYFSRSNQVYKSCIQRLTANSRQAFSLPYEKYGGHYLTTRGLVLTVGDTKALLPLEYQGNALDFNRFLSSQWSSSQNHINTFIDV